MEEALQRARYTRTSSAYRKKRKNSNDNHVLLEKLFKQAFLCVCILIIVGAVKYINTPATNFVSDKIKLVLFQNIELKSIYTSVDEFFSNLLKEKNKEKSPTSDVISNTTNSSALANENTSTLRTTGAEGIIDTDSENKIVKEINLKYKFITPVSGKLTSPFGERIHPLLKKLLPHNGVDIEANKGDEIKAALKGVVSEAGNDASLGNYMKINCGDNIQTVYAHCSKTLYKKGDEIKQGQVIGYVGDTGLAVGTHLHFEIWVKQKAYDPMNFIKAIT